MNWDAVRIWTVLGAGATRAETPVGTGRETGGSGATKQPPAGQHVLPAAKAPAGAAETSAATKPGATNPISQRVSWWLTLTCRPARMVSTELLGQVVM